MELEGLKRAAACPPQTQIAQTQTQQTQARQAQTPRAVRSPAVDRLTLSEQAREAKEARDRKTVEEVFRRRREAMEARRAALEEALSQDRSASPAVSMGKCLEIAARIMGGDRVPEEDEKFLSQFAPELYRQAVLMRRVREDPEDCDSVLDEEDLEDSGAAEVMTVLRPELRRLGEALVEGAGEAPAMDWGTAE